MVGLRNIKPKNCQCGGDCVCKKPAKKQVRVGVPAAMYKNDAGTSYALSYIASEIGRQFGYMFGAFTIAEEEGELIVRTGLRRDTHMEELVKNSCKQPCEGSCEDGCSKPSTREVAGL